MAESRGSWRLFTDFNWFPSTGALRQHVFTLPPSPLFLRDIRPCRSRGSSRDVRTALVIPEKQLRRETLKRENCAFSSLLPLPSTLLVSDPVSRGCVRVNRESARIFARVCRISCQTRALKLRSVTSMDERAQVRIRSGRYAAWPGR